MSTVPAKSSPGRVAGYRASSLGDHPPPELAVLGRRAGTRRPLRRAGQARHDHGRAFLIHPEQPLPRPTALTGRLAGQHAAGNRLCVQLERKRPEKAGFGLQGDSTTFLNDVPRALRRTNSLLVPLKEKEGSLVWRAYAGQVADKLQEHGLERAERSSDANYAVFINYSVGEDRTTVGSVPMYGQTSPSTTQTTTTMVNGRPFTSTTTTPATYGITGYSARSSTVYGRRVKMVMTTAGGVLKGEAIRTFYEATGDQRGRLERPQRSVPEDAGRSFPRLAGQVRLDARADDSGQVGSA